MPSFTTPPLLQKVLDSVERRTGRPVHLDDPARLSLIPACLRLGRTRWGQPEDALQLSFVKAELIFKGSSLLRAAPRIATARLDGPCVRLVQEEHPAGKASSPATPSPTQRLSDTLGRIWDKLPDELTVADGRFEWHQGAGRTGEATGIQGRFLRQQGQYLLEDFRFGYWGSLAEAWARLRRNDGPAPFHLETALSAPDLDLEALSRSLAGVPLAQGRGTLAGHLAFNPASPLETLDGEGVITGSQVRLLPEFLPPRLASFLPQAAGRLFEKIHLEWTAKAGEVNITSGLAQAQEGTLRVKGTVHLASRQATLRLTVEKNEGHEEFLLTLPAKKDE